MLAMRFLFMVGWYAVTAFRRPSTTLSPRSSLLATLRPITYRSIEIPVTKRKDTVEVLIDERNMDVLSELQKLISSGKKANSEALEELTKKEAAFAISDVTSIELYEEAMRLRHVMQTQPKIYRKPRNPYSNIDTFVNIGTAKKLFLVKSYLELPSLKDLPSEKINDIQQSNEGFRNISKLFDVERRKNKAARIPEMLMEHNYSWQSAQWAKYLDNSFNSNQASLAHAILEYYKTSTAEVVGNGNFRRKPGYLGSLAPPEDETMATGSYMLPKRILHPWPDAAEIPMYVRWATSHPRTPSVHIMMAKNGKFEESLLVREDEDAIRPGTPKDPIYAGFAMEGRDAVRIARFVTEGAAYDPAIQIEHPGLLSDEHGKLPFYNAAHGPTMNELDTLPERDEEFWANLLPSVDPTVLLEKHIPRRPVPVIDELEMAEEESIREQRARSIFMSFENSTWKQEEIRLEEIVNNNIRAKFASLEMQLDERHLPTNPDIMDENSTFIAANYTLQHLSGDDVELEFLPTESLITEQNDSRTASILPHEQRKGPLGESSFLHDSRFWLDWEYDPLPDPVPVSITKSSMTNRLESYRENVTLRYDLQHGPLRALLPPEHNPFVRDENFHRIKALLEKVDAKLDQEIMVPLGNDYLRTTKRSVKTSKRRILSDFEKELSAIDENDDNVAYYFDSIRRLVRSTIRRRFSHLYGNSFEKFTEAMGLIDGKLPGSLTNQRKLKGNSKEEREKWQEEFFDFFYKELVPRANTVIKKKFLQATSQGYRSAVDDPSESFDSSEISLPVLTIDPSDEMSTIFSNPNVERDFVKKKREQIIKNEKSMMRFLQAADGRTRGTKEQMEFSMAIAGQAKDTLRKVRGERKLFMSYKVHGNDDEASRGRRSGKTRLPAAEVPPPREQSVESGLFEEDKLFGEHAATELPKFEE